MSKHIRMLFVGAALLLVGAFTASSAQATTGIQLNSGGNQTITATGVLTMNSGDAICDVSLTLTSNGTILKTGNTGETVTAGSITNCTGTLVNSRGNSILAPIAVTYTCVNSNGGLPNITEILATGTAVGFSLATIFGACLYGGDLPVVFSIGTGDVTGAYSDSLNNLSLRRSCEMKGYVPWAGI